MVAHLAVDGRWETWAAWSPCYPECGPGTQYRNRTCVGPFHGGSECTGPEDEEQDCVVKECPSKLQQSRPCVSNHSGLSVMLMPIL